MIQRLMEFNQVGNLGYFATSTSSSALQHRSISLSALFQKGATAVAAHLLKRKQHNNTTAHSSKASSSSIHHIYMCLKTAFQAISLECSLASGGEKRRRIAARRNGAPVRRGAHQQQVLIGSGATRFKHQDYGGGTPHTGRHMKANVVCG